MCKDDRTVHKIGCDFDYRIPLYIPNALWERKKCTVPRKVLFKKSKQLLSTRQAKNR